MRKNTSRSFATRFVLFILYISAVFITIELVIMGISALIDGQINGVKPLLIAIVAAFFLYRIGKKKVQPLLDKLPIKSHSSRKDAPSSSSTKAAAATQIEPSKPRSHVSGLPELPGYTVKYTYDEVKIALTDKFFPIVDLQFDDLLTLKQEPENPYDSKAVAIYRGEDQLGYLYRGKLQNMANDWLDRGDPVYGLYEASTDIETFTIYFFS